MGAKTDPSMDAKDKQMAASGRSRRAEKIRRDELPEASPEIDDGSFSMMGPSQRDEGASRGFEGAINRSRRGRRGRRGGPRGGGRPPMFGGDPRRGGGDPRRGGGRPPFRGGSNSQYETNSKFRTLIDKLMEYKGKR